MTKCENCYHENLCKFFDEGVMECRNFKDKFLIVELLCKAGDTVYEFDDKIYLLVILTIEITENDIKFNCIEIDEESFIDPYSDVDIGINRSFSISDINKTVFLTREDAEKALNAQNAV